MVEGRHNNVIEKKLRVFFYCYHVQVRESCFLGACGFIFYSQFTFYSSQS